MKSILNIFLVIFCSLVLFSCSEELVDKVQTGSLKGIVVKKGTNQPLKNVKIFTTPSTETIFTKDDGSFQIDNIPLGDYSVKAELNGYLTSFQGVTLKTAGQVDSVVLELADDKSKNTPPSAPVLLSPVDNAVNQPLSVDLSWTSTDADSTDVLKY